MRAWPRRSSRRACRPAKSSTRRSSRPTRFSTRPRPTRSLEAARAESRGPSRNRRHGRQGTRIAAWPGRRARGAGCAEDHPARDQSACAQGPARATGSRDLGDERNPDSGPPLCPRRVRSGERRRCARRLVAEARLRGAGGQRCARACADRRSATGQRGTRRAAAAAGRSCGFGIRRASSICWSRIVASRCCRTSPRCSKNSSASPSACSRSRCAPRCRCPCEQADAIKVALKKRFGREIELEQRLDPAVIGGAVIDAGDVVIDGSVRGRLARLQRALMQ